MSELPFNGKVTSFEDLDAWKNSRAVKLRVRELVRLWPDDEKYRLTDQIIRSSRSPGSQLAEGFGRFYEKDNVRFCRIARGSLYETKNHLWDALDEGYIDQKTHNETCELIIRAIQTVNGYIRYLLSMGKRYTVSEPGGPDPESNPDLP
jgi:four helix bundle protein